MLYCGKTPIARWQVQVKGAVEETILNGKVKEQKIYPGTTFFSST